MEHYVTKFGITDEAAQALRDAAIDAASDRGVRVCIAVLDESGLLRTFQRMAGANPISVQLSQDKAYSTFLGNRSSFEWSNILDNDPAGARGIPVTVDRLLPVGGGFPIFAQGGFVGAIGVSGATTVEDMEIAREAIAAVGIGD